MAASRWFRQIDDGFAMVQTELRDGDDGVERSRWSRSTTALRDRDELRLRDGSDRTSGRASRSRWRRRRGR
ncbi:hypothetical protein LOK49_LG03G01954 [Camellia lanceoleosa]|uniref:Uncharacterized protein n=2 Tax=Camellia lanceoleosa TaxID=1840588 RepID=A0ACC0GL23_9ERIC|nr:hypothetical protein LOK49_LG09G01501 [Camellia lanceoleosa]KAI8021898.1 hypothetical protein LOK49_LG03G01954 [Camellia lanceoleosa]